MLKSPRLLPLQATQAPALPTTPGSNSRAAPASIAVPTNNLPTIEANSPTPNDETQARLRVSQCVPDEPDMDVFMSGKVPVTADVPMSLGAGDVSRYEYLPPGTVRVAVVPSGMGIDKALLAPLDVTLSAGHRYTLVVLGQPDENDHPGLLIDETEAYQKAGAVRSSSRHLTVNNVKGGSALSFLFDGEGAKDVPYGGYAAAVRPNGDFKKMTIALDGKLLGYIDNGYNSPGVDELDCYFGSPSTADTHTSASTSELTTLELLQAFSAEHVKNGDNFPTFATFLAAVKSAGLADLLTTGGPYLVIAPTDEAFAALPKDQLDAFMADPNAARAYIVEGYYPTGTMGQNGTFYHRTVTNLLGEQFVLSGTVDDFVINGVHVGIIMDNAMVANGTRVPLINAPDDAGRS